MTIRTPTEAPALVSFTTIELRLPKKFVLSAAWRRRIGAAPGGRVGRLRKGQNWRNITLPAAYGFLADMLVREVGNSVTVVALDVRLRGRECPLPTAFNLYTMEPGMPVIDRMAQVLEKRIGDYARQMGAYARGELYARGLPGMRRSVLGKCEKCGAHTYWTIAVADRTAYWCGCGCEYLRGWDACLMLRECPASGLARQGWLDCQSGKALPAQVSLDK